MSKPPREFISKSRVPVVAIGHGDKRDRFNVAVILALAVMVRLYKLPIPDEVVFDEVHFGGFAQDYYRGKFFVDVHPPLVKLMYYWVGWICGWDGKFEFAAIGDQFDNNVPFVAMRLLSASFGILAIIFTYLGLRVNFVGPTVSFFTAIMMIIENSMVTQSRFMFLDSALLLTMSMTWYFYGKFKSQKPFSFQWYQTLHLCGLCLGVTISTKLSGLLFYVWVGLITLKHLWLLLGDVKVSDIQWWKHLLWRIWAFIGIPLITYLLIFAIHFDHLPYLGRGSGLMSPNFKASSRDNSLVHQPLQVGYGSHVTIKHNEMEKYLHSHAFDYKTGSKLQQVTLYESHTDYSNEWELHPRTKRTDDQLQNKFVPIKNGDIVRLFHRHTGKFLQVSNEFKPPITEKDYAKEAACNGTREMLGDSNFEFRVRIIDIKRHGTPSAMMNLRATESVFQLVHQGTGCLLLSHKGKLPKWGFSQNEVLCIKEATIPNTLWYIEKNTHSSLVKNYETSNLYHYPFLNKVWEYHKTIWKINQGLTDHHPFASDPSTWPFTLNGVSYFLSNARPKSVAETGSQVYLLGNLTIYYLTIIVVFLIGLKQILHGLQRLNPFITTNEPIDVTIFYDTTFDSICGFIINYVPYFYMNRQLFLHHYLPALYFGIITLGHFIQFELNKRRRVTHIMMLASFILSLFCFVQFLPLIYGTEWTQRACRSLKWFDAWNFDCSAYKY